MDVMSQIGLFSSKTGDEVQKQKIGKQTKNIRGLFSTLD